jgi:hypothetical protein
MDTEGVSLVLWIVAGSLALVSVIGVGLAIILEKRFSLLPADTAKSAESRGARVAALREEIPPRPVDEKALAARKAAYRQGVFVLIGLAVLTALEFVVATALSGSVVLLFVLVLAKAGLILQFYMHVGHLWSEEEAH